MNSQKQYLRNLIFFGYLITELVVFVLQLDGEGGVVGALEDHRTSGLPDEAVSGGSSDAIPKCFHVQVSAFS